MISCDKTGKLFSLLNFKDWRSRGKEKKKKPQIPNSGNSCKIASKYQRTLTFPLKIESNYYYYFIIIFDWFLIIVLLLVLGNWVIVQCVNNNTSFVVYEMQSISRQLEIWRDLLKV